MTFNKDDLLNHQSFCVLPWIHFHGLPDGSIHPCCISVDIFSPMTTANNKTFLEIINQDSFNAMRIQMLSGIKPSKCEPCFNKIFDNPRSFRNTSNLLITNDDSIIDIVNSTNDDGSLPKFEMKYLDIRFSNLCDLKCRGCNEHVSSSWHFENSKSIFGFDNRPRNGVINLADKSPNLLSELLNGDTLKNIKKIYFAGGEPLIMKEHYQILDKIIEFGNVDTTLTYNTNGANFNYDKQLFDKWKKFPYLHLGVSIDDIGDRLEFYRHGVKWQTLIDGLKKFHEEIPNSYRKIGMQITVSAFNVFSLPEIIEYFLKNNLISLDCVNEGPMAVNINLLTNPEEQSVTIFSTSQKHKIADKLRSLYSSEFLSEDFIKAFKNQIEMIISFMFSRDDSSLMPKFLSEIQIFDNRRNENFQETYKELYELINEN